MATFFYSVLHFLVDFACANAMFRYFTEGADGYWNILVYNFCAFALQMPLGTLLDAAIDRRDRLPALYAALGAALTIGGSFLHPAILGLGNALFHVGGGVGVIREDHARGWRGRALGVFVAPGALGLFLGGKLSGEPMAAAAVLILMALLVLPLLRMPSHPALPDVERRSDDRIALFCCFAVVIVRSFVGMAVGFAWKQGFALSLASVVAVVLGKIAGGFAAAGFGTRKTVVCSLLIACGCYLLGNSPVFGIAALFFFNMTMPITLYQLALRYPRLPGFSFGLLTFALFLGFLPVYFGWELPVSDLVLGAVGCLCSLALLLPVCRRETQ